MGGRGREGMETANDRAEIDDKREAAVAAAAAARACMIQFSAFLEPRQQAVSDAETAFQLSRYAIKVAICWLWWATQRRQQHEHSAQGTTTRDALAGSTSAFLHFHSFVTKMNSFQESKH